MQTASVYTGVQIIPGVRENKASRIDCDRIQNRLTFSFFRRKKTSTKRKNLDGLQKRMRKSGKQVTLAEKASACWVMPVQGTRHVSSVPLV